ncbi:hypothetical protein EFL26_05315 [Nocardioides pocheonensis]|uniref:Uncharacterized protein n=2 Tax=Nocardioides pocheonensis TaxID=661485 RepID=A0A3N0GW10_9ACTN|nr:hypothetical protein EFL26_05315 [Nocardioides pocheonensis]
MGSAYWTGANGWDALGYTGPMSDYETPPADADRTITDAEEVLDPEAPTDSPLVNPPRDDGDRPVPELEDVDDDFQAENAGSSLDQPSDQSS